MAETRSTKWRSTKPIPACFNATINNNASLKNEKSRTNAKPDATLEQQAQTGTALGKLGHMVTLHMLCNFLHSAEMRRSHTHEMIQSQIL